MKFYLVRRYGENDRGPDGKDLEGMTCNDQGDFLGPRSTVAMILPKDTVETVYAKRRIVNLCR